MGPLLLLVCMGNPWISGLPCVGWLWPFVGGKDSLCHALWSSFVLGVSGFLPLAMVEAGGQMGASGAGGPLRISGDGVLVLVCLCCLLGTGVS